MQPPVQFTERLHREFDGRLRCRWSQQRSEWQIEFKIAPGQVPGMSMPRESQRDSIIRAQDGYALVCSVQRGDRMPCPRCGITLKVPVFEFGQTRCDYCTQQGFKAVFNAGYFPLESDRLMEHLRKIDPLRTWHKQIVAAVDAQNQRILDEQEQKIINHTESVAKDNIKQLFGIPSVGYTGKVFTGN